MTQDGGMLSTKQEEDSRVGVVLMCRHCGCGYGLGLNRPTIIGGVHVKDIKATLRRSETVARYAPPSELLYLLDSSR